MNVEFCTSSSSSLFDFARSMTFPLERKLRHFLIGSNNGSSLAVKVTFSLSRASSAKSRKSAEPKDFVYHEKREISVNRGFDLP
ncbi:hypothetical protein M5K25_027935 [Dendrobium thyrsiflorum]|uniref:Uncharacterized protein n=1 Tax=Dendrobium thyrsiflorum TaxID=117978 RepID=A0ABD0TV47_DENTH